MKKIIVLLSMITILFSFSVCSASSGRLVQLNDYNGAGNILERYNQSAIFFVKKGEADYHVSDYLVDSTIEMGSDFDANFDLYDSFGENAKVTFGCNKAGYVTFMVCEALNLNKNDFSNIAICMINSIYTNGIPNSETTRISNAIVNAINNSSHASSFYSNAMHRRYNISVKHHTNEALYSIFIDATI